MHTHFCYSFIFFLAVWPCRYFYTSVCHITDSFVLISLRNYIRIAVKTLAHHIHCNFHSILSSRCFIVCRLLQFRRRGKIRPAKNCTTWQKSWRFRQWIGCKKIYLSWIIKRSRWFLSFLFFSPFKSTIHLVAQNRIPARNDPNALLVAVDRQRDELPNVVNRIAKKSRCHRQMKTVM